MSKIEIKDLYLIFGNEKQKALKMLKKDKSKEEILKDTGCTVGVKDANLSINEGEFFVIMGLSGSGKSTLLRCINRLIRPTAGQVLVNGVDISKISEKRIIAGSPERAGDGFPEFRSVTSPFRIEQYRVRPRTSGSEERGT